jgi:Xaa-Pro aminopeptidase
MRHGLIAWSRDEVPASALDARVAKLQAAMREERLDAVLVYTSFPRPAAVAWLTHFVPYWNDALLALFPDGAPVLLASFSKRMNPWIHETSHVGEVRSAPDLGAAAAQLIAERRASRVGVVELDALPWRIAEPIVNAGFEKTGSVRELTDASALFTRVRHPADAVEIALAKRATAIANSALAAASDGSRLASHALAAAERSARLDGAEDVIARLAPDLREDATLARMEGDAPLGARWALELTLSYKGTTVRVARSFATGAQPRSWGEAERWFVQAVTTDDLNDAPGQIVSWRVDASIGTAPLQTVQTDSEGMSVPLPKGALLMMSMRLDLADGPWLAGGPSFLYEGPLG